MKPEVRMLDMLTMQVGDFAIWQYISLLILAIAYIGWKGR
jgi:hypothetical protein